MTRPEECPHDHSQLREDLERLTAAEIGRLAQPLLPGAMTGEAGPQTLFALRLLGEALAQWKAA